MDENLIYAVCPNCDEELEYDSFIFEEVDGDNAYFSAVGYCLKCGKRQKWVETYSVSRISNYVEIEEESEI